MTLFEVFYVRADLSAGTYTIERDFGVSGLADCILQVDVEELASTTYQADVYTRETDTDGWWLIGGMGSSAVDNNGLFTFQRYRYVKVVVTTTGGSQFESGAVVY